MDKKEVYTHRHIARIILKAETPLFVGSGEASLTTDAIVQRDVHGFPMIPGSSLTGVLRHALEENETVKNKWNSFFGYQYQAPKGKEGLGSQVRISSAYLLLNNEKVAEGIEIEEEQKELLRFFNDLPVRQHVRINHRGVADTEKKGLFDNEVVYAGGRFKFEIELKGDAGDKDLWEEFLKELRNPLFRIGQGTRYGYGKLSVEKLETRTFNLTQEPDFTDYLNYDNSLNSTLIGFNKFEKDAEEGFVKYKLELKPDSFFIFSAGYSDEEVDNVPVTEKLLEYNDNKLKLSNVEYTLIPGSSIKGALRHRTSFHYNKLKEHFADKYNDSKFLEFIETKNDAVYELFGAELGNEERDGMRGKVMIDDKFVSIAKNDKIFNHVAIDRFTGGAMDGALFSEKVSYFEDKNETLTMEIAVEGNKEDYSPGVIEAFEETLKDVCKGILPLGGMTTKGHGAFTGKLFRNDEKIFDYDENK